MDFKWASDINQFHVGERLLKLFIIRSFDLIVVPILKWKEQQKNETDANKFKKRYNWFAEVRFYSLRSFEMSGATSLPVIIFNCPSKEDTCDLLCCEFTTTNENRYFRSYIFDHHFIRNWKYRLWSIMSRGGLRFHGGVGRIPWNESCEVVTMRVINDRFLLMISREWNNEAIRKSEYVGSYLEVVDLFNTLDEGKDEKNVITSKRAFSISIPLDSYIFHWFDISTNLKGSLQSHRSAVITMNSIRILDGYLELVERIEDLHSNMDSWIQHFMDTQKRKRIKLWNVRANKYEIHYSAQWRAATNLLSIHQRPFPHTSNVSFLVCNGSPLILMKSDGMREHNRRSDLTEDRMENDFSFIMHETIYCYERFVLPNGHENVRIIIQCPNVQDEYRQLIMVVFEKKENQWKMNYFHPLHLCTDAYWQKWIKDLYVPDCDGEIWNPPRVLFSGFKRLSYGEITVFVYDDQKRAINVIQINKDIYERRKKLRIKLHQKYRTKNFWLSPPTFVRVSCEDNGNLVGLNRKCVIDSFKIDCNGILKKWTIRNIWSCNANAHVRECKMCYCGKSLAYVFQESVFKSVFLRIVSTVSGNVLLEFEGCNLLENAIQFRPHHSRDHVCAILWTFSDTFDPAVRYRQLIVVSDDGQSAKSQQVHSKYIPETSRPHMRSAFSSCGEYFVSWHKDDSMWSSYRICESKESLACELILLNEWVSSFSSILINAQSNVVFDQFS